eukprot:13027746-Alexandrium_andersonii.AAC.1
MCIRDRFVHRAPRLNIRWSDSSATPHGAWLKLGKEKRVSTRARPSTPRWRVGAMESSGKLEQPQAAAPEGLLADLLGTSPDPLEMSGEELGLLVIQVDDLIGLNPVLRQVASRSSDA